MTHADDLRAYKARWDAIEAIQREERSSAPITLRWQQLKVAFGMAKSLGLLRPDPSETGVFERWAKLKKASASKPPKA